MPEFREITLPEVTLRAAIEGQGPLVVMVHGFPESWYSWRHQMGPIAEAGFTACAIDVRGYGGSSRPPAIEDYDMEHMVGDVAGVIEALSPGAPAVLVGHDWARRSSGTPPWSAPTACAPSPACRCPIPACPSGRSAT